MMSIRNPSFPWIPPSGEWVLITIHLTAVAIPVINVIIVINHNISVARLLRFLNLVHQLLLPKCKYRWIQTSVINNNPISIWIHTDKYPLLWATSSWIPESNTAAKAITRLQLQSYGAQNEAFNVEVGGFWWKGLNMYKLESNGGIGWKKRSVSIAWILVYISGVVGLHEADIRLTFRDTGFTSPVPEVGW